MTDWTAGYTAEVAYTFGYYGELNPLRIRLAFLDAGLAFPEVGVACELGFGQGVSTNVHAAASQVQWWGTDFNPAQACFAQGLAQAAGTGAHLYEDAFADFARRSDLPDFDFIALHGIWSWISDENRQTIVNFIARKLRAGGVLYISYNTFPGWTTFAPMRHLFAQHAAVLGTQGQGILARVDGAMEFAEQLLAVNPLFAKASPVVLEKLKHLKKQNRHYLAHEYFNQHWQPVYFAQMQQALESAKLQFACSAHYADHLDVLNLTAEQQGLLKGIADADMREGVRDFMVNQQFRRDYWVKGMNRLPLLEQLEQLRALKVVLVSPRAGLALKFKGSLGEASPQGPVYEALLDAMADHRVYSLAELESALAAMPGASLPKIKEALLALASAGHVSPAQDAEPALQARARTDGLNAQLMRLSRSSHDFNYLASPVTGGGVLAPRFSQLFLAFSRAGAQDAAGLAQQVWALLQLQGQKLQKDGNLLDSTEENLQELQAQAQQFLDRQLPILRALQVA